MAFRPDDIPPAGTWDCDGVRLKPQPGQVLLKTQGFGRMSYGTDTIEVGPGLYGLGTWAMREAQGPANCVRVLITFLNPHAHAFFIRKAQIAALGAHHSHQGAQTPPENRAFASRHQGLGRGIDLIAQFFHGMGPIGTNTPGIRGLPCNAYDTVIGDTFARPATAFIAGIRCWSATAT